MKSKSLVCLFLLLIAGLMFVNGRCYGCGGGVKPQAVLDADPQYALVGESIVFDGNSSYDYDGTIEKYEWDWTNNSSYDYNETPGDGIATHSYDSAGTYTCKLRVTDDDDLTDTDTETVYVSDRYYVGPNGDDNNNGLTWATAFATIQKGITEADYGDPNDYAIVDINSGTYQTGPIIIDNNNIQLLFEPNVTVWARSYTHPDDPNNSEDANSFRYHHACLFYAQTKDNIIFDGNDTILRMRRDEYPPPWSSLKFNPADDVNLASDQITIADHGLKVGDAVRYGYYGDTALGGLTKYTWYYAIVVDNDTIQLATSFADAENGTQTDLTEPTPDNIHYVHGGEFRHVIDLRSCNNITISGLTCRDSGGDGIFISRHHDHVAEHYSQNITITDVNCDNNLRQGISVISVDGLTIENCILQNSNGTSPGSGIDFEAGHSGDKLTNIVMRNTTVKDNENYGLIVSPGGLGSAGIVDIVIEDCNLMGKRAIGINGGKYGNEPSGLVEFKNITVHDSNMGLWTQKSYEGVDVHFENCVWQDMGPDYVMGIDYIICVLSVPNVIEKAGGIEFINCQIIDDYDRPVIGFDNSGSGDANLYEIHGDLHVINPNRPGELYDWKGATLHKVDMTFHRGLACSDTNDVNLSDPNVWNDVNDLQVWDFYLLDANNNVYTCSKKYVYAACNLDANHCQTDNGNAIPHLHFESDFNEAEIAAANRYWDWYYDVNSTGIVRDSNATNARDSLAYAMDGYAGSANYDYWIMPSEISNKIFTDDCTKDNSSRPPTSADANDRLAYEGFGDIYRHATIVNSVDDSNEPNQIQWKCCYSGVYKYTYDANDDCYATGGSDDVNQPIGSSPSGTWDPNYWDSNDVDVYYDN